MDDLLNNILDRLDNVSRRGSYWVASCPTRRDSNPSMTITTGRDGQVLLHDFGGSSVEEMVEAMGLTMSDLFVDDPSGKKVWMETVKRERKPKTYKKPEVPVDPSFREGAIRWFAQRGISVETMKHYGVFTEPHYFHKPKKETPAICIPYRENGEIVNIKYRSAVVKDFAMATEAKPILYNLDATPLILDKKEVIVVEGEIDLFSLHEAKILNTVTIPNGSDSMTEEVFLSGRAFFADDAVRVVLAGDKDEAGQRLMDEIARRVGKERCARVTWPEGCKDANDTLIKHGAGGIAACIAEAIPLPVDGIIEVDDVMDGVWSLYADGLPPGTSTGIASLDEFYTIRTGSWSVFTAAPGAGKSNLLDQIIVNLAERDDWRFAIASLENLDIPRHIANIMPKHARKSFGSRYAERMSPEEIEDGRLWMRGHFSFIRPEEPTVEAILNRAKALVFAKGIKGLVIDPWNEMDHPPSGLNNGDYISRCLSLIRHFAHAHDVHVWLVAHPTKLMKDAKGQYPVPTLYDISGSAHFFNKADFGVSMWRDRLDFTKPVQVHIQKSRFAEVATLGSMEIGYDPATTRYYDLKATGEDDNENWRPKSFVERMEEREETFEESEGFDDFGLAAGD